MNSLLAVMYHGRLPKRPYPLSYFSICEAKGDVVEADLSCYVAIVMVSCDVRP